MKTHEVDVCIAGGGPAGMVAGILLAKAGLRVLVLEMHEDFAREYRGEVLMPRFTQMMRQIGLFEFLEKYPHRKLSGFEGYYRNRPLIRIGFDKIAPEAPFALWMPQPVLLGALHDKAKTFPTFDLWFGARVKDTIDENGACVGVVAVKDQEEIQIRAKVVVGADGRFSVLRRQDKFEVDYKSHKFDLVWFTVPEPENYQHQVQFFLTSDRNYLILPKYPRSLQIGVVVSPGEFSKFRKEGIDAFRKVLLETGQPIIEKFAREIRDFSHFNVLQATLEHVRDWERGGLVLIGDSAHTCSPAGAIGVSVAVETAIVAADVIRNCFKTGDFSKSALNRIQELRDGSVKRVHAIQERVSGILFPRSRFLAKVAVPILLFITSRLGLFRRFQRSLMVLPGPMPISSDLGFKTPA